MGAWGLGGGGRARGRRRIEGGVIVCGLSFVRPAGRSLAPKPHSFPCASFLSRWYRFHFWFLRFACWHTVHLACLRTRRHDLHFQVHLLALPPGVPSSHLQVPVHVYLHIHSHLHAPSLLHTSKHPAHEVTKVLMIAVSRDPEDADSSSSSLLARYVIL